jgi:hypothetical protein
MEATRERRSMLLAANLAREALLKA